MTMHRFAPLHTGLYDGCYIEKHAARPVRYTVDRGTLWREVGEVVELNEGRIRIVFYGGCNEKDYQVLRGQAEDILTGRVNTMSDPGWADGRDGRWTRLLRRCEQAEQAAALEHALRRGLSLAGPSMVPAAVGEVAA